MTRHAERVCRLRDAIRQQVNAHRRQGEDYDPSSGQRFFAAAYNEVFQEGQHQHDDVGFLDEEFTTLTQVTLGAIGHIAGFRVRRSERAPPLYIVTQSSHANLIQSINSLHKIAHSLEHAPATVAIVLVKRAHINQETVRIIVG